MTGKKNKKKTNALSTLSHNTTQEYPLQGRNLWVKQEYLPPSIKVNNISNNNNNGNTKTGHEPNPKSGKHKKTPVKPMSETVDKHVCYQKAVQLPKKEVKNLINLYVSLIYYLLTRLVFNH